MLFLRGCHLREPGGGINLSFELVSAWSAYTTGTCLQLVYRCGVPAQPRNGNRNGKPPKTGDSCIAVLDGKRFPNYVTVQVDLN
jgi:hypothetical protein